LEKDRSQRMNLEMLRPGIPEKAVKSFSARNKGTHKKNKKNKTWLEDRGSHHELAY
jgi:hypothetical protein